MHRRQCTGIISMGPFRDLNYETASDVKKLTKLEFKRNLLCEIFVFILVD